MLERLNGNEKGDAIVSVRGYEPIWSRFTPSFELKDVYFAEGKADISKREARLFDKDKYVFDILGGSREEEEEKQLDAIERREQEQAEEEKKKVPDIAATRQGMERESGRSTHEGTESGGDARGRRCGGTLAGEVGA